MTLVYSGGNNCTNKFFGAAKNVELDLNKSIYLISLDWMST